MRKLPGGTEIYANASTSNGSTSNGSTSTTGGDTEIYANVTTTSSDYCWDGRPGRRIPRPEYTQWRISGKFHSVISAVTKIFPTI